MPPVRTFPPHHTSVGLIRTTLLAAVPFAAIFLIAVTLTGCGGSSSAGNSSADPATVIPATAPLYASALVRPGGSLKTDAISTARTLTNLANPYGSLVQALRGPGSSQLDFDREVKPWLGNRAGIFITSINASSSLSLSGSGSGSLLGPLRGLLGQSAQNGPSTASPWQFGTNGIGGAIVLDTANLAKARSFLDAEATHARAHASSYRGVDYLLSAKGAAWGIVGHFAVIGSESGLQSVIDTEQGGAPLIHDGAYAKLLSVAPQDALVNVYMSQGKALGALLESGAHGAQALLGEVPMLLAGSGSLDLSLVPSSNSVELDADSLAPGPSTSSSGAGASEALGASGAQALGQLPGGSWLAIGLGSPTSTLGHSPQALHSMLTLFMSALRSSGPEGSEAGDNVLDGDTLKGILGGILAPLSSLSAAELQRDFLSWMGSVSLFASGNDLPGLKGGVIIDSTNSALSRAAVARFASLTRTGHDGTVSPLTIPGTEAAASVQLEGVPLALDVAAGPSANGHSDFVIGLGASSVEEALHPSSALSGSPSYGAAASTLGDTIKPSVMVEAPTLVSIFETAGLNQDPSISSIFPHLQKLTKIDGGGTSLAGAVRRFRIVLGLAQAES